MNVHTLQNSDNYKKSLNNNTHEIFSKYISVINEFITQFSESIKIKKTSYYIYVLNKGVETLCHIFKTILLYTRNLQVTYIQTQKAVYYYIEFMCQIGESSHSFLQLNSKDATLFVYKKTIFEINNEIKKNFEFDVEESNITDTMELLYNIFNSTIISLTKNIVDNVSETIDKKDILNIMPKISEITKNLLNISLDPKDKIYKQKLYVVEIFNNYLSLRKIYESKYIIEFTKQIKNVYITQSKLHHKINIPDNNQNINNMEYKKYIFWILN